MAQIVIMKAWEGFADRLQVLSHLIAYCHMNKSVLCVDWRDENWGQGRWDFNDFFEIIGIPTITLDMIPYINQPTIVPSSWRLEFIKQPMKKLFLRNEFTCTMESSIFSNIYKKIEGDIIVINGRGFRKYYSENIIGNLRFKKPVSELIKKRLSSFYLPATVVHLRGTDRYLPELLDMWFKEYEALMPHNKARVYHITDSIDLMKQWQEKVPHSQLCFPGSSILKIPSSTKQGSHKLCPEALEFYDVSKYDLIIDSLADFMALAYATDAIGLEKSIFFEMARSLSNFGTELIGDLLQGYQPPRKSLICNS